jgi:putative spermidine/putrescine transport system permease protein
MSRRWLLNLLVTLICLVLVAPIVIVVVLSFSGEGYLRFPPRSLSLHWYARVFGDIRWQRSLLTSAGVALGTCLLSTSVGFLAAYAFVRGEFRRKKLWLSLLLLPLIVPTIITAIALYFLAAQLGLVGNVVWLAICHSVVALPIVLLILVSALQTVDLNLERAALGLGAGRLMLFRRVVLPLAAPGLASAALFSFLASFDELVIALFLAGVKAQTLPVRIWNSLLLEVEPTIAAVSAFLIGVTILVLLIDWSVRRARQGSRRRATLA